MDVCFNNENEGGKTNEKQKYNRKIVLIALPP
jgi:hypothetical protein